MCPAKTLSDPALNVTGGATVAHIREEKNGTWWRCDDEAVTKLEGGPSSKLWGSGDSCREETATCSQAERSCQGTIVILDLMRLAHYKADLFVFEHYCQSSLRKSRHDECQHSAGLIVSKTFY